MADDVGGGDSLQGIGYSEDYGYPKVEEIPPTKTINLISHQIDNLQALNSSATTAQNNRQVSDIPLNDIYWKYMNDVILTLTLYV